MKKTTARKSRAKGKTIDEIRDEFLTQTQLPEREEPKKDNSAALAEEAKKAAVTLEEKMAVMTDDEMNSLLFELQISKFWVAYKRYVNYRLTYADNSLRALDPYKQPTDIARNQGIRMGIMDVEDYIMLLKKKMEDEDKPNVA